MLVFLVIRRMIGIQKEARTYNIVEIMVAAGSTITLQPYEGYHRNSFSGDIEQFLPVLMPSFYSEPLQKKVDSEVIQTCKHQSPHTIYRLD